MIGFGNEKVVEAHEMRDDNWEVGREAESERCASMRLCWSSLRTDE